MDKPIVSVIICVYNGEKYMERCLRSVLAQTYEAIEVLIINDGSTDRTIEICSKFADERFNIVNKEKNEGLSAARNTGLSVAQGKYVTFVDADDYIEPNFIENLCDSIERTNSDMAVCAYYREKASGKTCVISYGNDRVAVYEEAMAAIFEDNSWGGYTWNKLFQMDIVREVGWSFLPELRKGEDMVAVCQYMKACRSVSYVSKPLYHYMYNEASICRSVKNLNAVDQRDISNLKAHQMMEQLIQSDTKKVKNAFYCRLLCTHIRLLVNMTYCKNKDVVVMKQSQMMLRKYLEIFLRSSHRSMVEKVGAVILAIHPRLFWFAYGIMNKLFDITIS